MQAAYHTWNAERQEGQQDYTPRIKFWGPLWSLTRADADRCVRAAPFDHIGVRFVIYGRQRPARAFSHQLALLLVPLSEAPPFSSINSIQRGDPFAPPRLAAKPHLSTYELPEVRDSGSLDENRYRCGVATRGF